MFSSTGSVSELKDRHRKGMGTLKKGGLTPALWPGLVGISTSRCNSLWVKGCFVFMGNGSVMRDSRESIMNRDKG